VVPRRTPRSCRSVDAVQVQEGRTVPNAQPTPSRDQQRLYRAGEDVRSDSAVAGHIGEAEFLGQDRQPLPRSPAKLIESALPEHQRLPVPSASC
jgi:hypothetical protein